jgi:hypothetical protein
VLVHKGIGGDEWNIRIIPAIAASSIKNIIRATKRPLINDAGIVRINVNGKTCVLTHKRC